MSLVDPVWHRPQMLMPRSGLSDISPTPACFAPMGQFLHWSRRSGAPLSLAARHIPAHDSTLSDAWRLTHRNIGWSGSSGIVKYSVTESAPVDAGAKYRAQASKMERFAVTKSDQYWHCGMVTAVTEKLHLRLQPKTLFFFLFYIGLDSSSSSSVTM